MMSDPSRLPTLGVVVVTFNSAADIRDCLESLLASTGVRLRIAVVDNGSTDDTLEVVRSWASSGSHEPRGDIPFPIPPRTGPVELMTRGSDLDGLPGHGIALLPTGRNTGFAGGVNLGLAALAGVSDLDRFWVLNPDSVTPPGTAAKFATAEVGRFSLMGGRVLYLENPGMIQIDGGTVNRRTGVTGNLGLFQDHAATPCATPAQMDFITGASMVASREFYETVGPMREDYFLYYEEVDWALRRGDLPLVYCEEAVVYHRAGTSIGSAGLGRAASPFAVYFKNRARLMFMQRHFPKAVPVAMAWSLGKAAQFVLKGDPAAAAALLAGAFGKAPPGAVKGRLSPEARSKIGYS